jgi:Fe-S oxidoreductase
VNINPLEIIVDLRRYLIMEESKSPDSITVMFNNIENNGAPWAFAASDRELIGETRNINGKRRIVARCRRERQKNIPYPTRSHQKFLDRH